MSACKDDDLSTEIGNLNNYESFDEQAFNLFDEELSFGIEDCEMGLDNSILMIGIDYQPPTPALLKLDSNFEVDFSKEITLVVLSFMSAHVNWRWDGIRRWVYSNQSFFGCGAICYF